MTRAAFLIPLLLPLLVLAACNKAPAPSATKAAGADVLPGTISDAMLNTDRSQAQPMLQPYVGHKNAKADASDDASDAAADAPADTSAKPDVKPAVQAQ